jgi:hypothetical protein
MMGTWFWLNIPLAPLFVCCWVAIPMWLWLTRWDAEVKARAVLEPVVARSAPATAAYQTAAPSL